MENNSLLCLWVCFRFFVSFDLLDILQVAKKMVLYWVNLSKRGGKDGVFQGLAGLLRGAALPAQGKPRPSRLFYSDLHSISNTVFQNTEVSRRVIF